MFTSYEFRIIKKHPVLTKRRKLNLIKDTSCNVLLRMLLVCIRRKLKSILRYKFLILDTLIPTLYTFMRLLLIIQRNFRAVWMTAKNESFWSWVILFCVIHLEADMLVMFRNFVFLLKKKGFFFNFPINRLYNLCFKCILKFLWPTNAQFINHIKC
jgi:hypothetical protein